MTSRSGRGRWQRVVDAREQARSALDGRAEANPSGAPVKRRAPAKPSPPRPTYVPNPYLLSIAVLSIGEAAVRLRVSRDELEAMIDAGKIKALPTGFTRMIPISEVERLA